MTNESNSYVVWIEDHYRPGETFPSLSFAKYTKTEKIDKCAALFKQAINEIAARNLKKRKQNTAIIYWARSVQKEDYETLKTITVKQYFYNKACNHLLMDKLFFRNFEETIDIKNQRKILEAVDAEQEYNEQLDKTDDRQERPIQYSDSNKYNNDAAEQHSQNNDANEPAIEFISGPDLLFDVDRFDEEFAKLDDSRKWYLSTGKCVENELYVFAKQCRFNHPSHSMILDFEDYNYKIYNVFTKEEIAEMRSFKEKTLPKLPPKLKSLLNSFRLSSTKEIRAKLGEVSTFNNIFNLKQDHDHDWIVFTLYTFLRQYEYNNFSRPHKEAWYQNHIWCMFETVYDADDNLEAVVGEATSFASQKRKNKERCIPGLEEMDTMKLGHRMDLIFRQYNNLHEVPAEFGAAETGSNNDGKFGTKLMEEGFCKLPRTLKDMLDDLMCRVDYDEAKVEKLRTIGLLHSGLSSILLQADKPSPYITRIIRYKQIDITGDIKSFSTSVIPTLYSAFAAREVVREVERVLLESDHEHANDSEWLDDCLTPAKLPPIPETTKSTEQPRKRNKHSKEQT